MPLHDDASGLALEPAARPGDPLDRIDTPSLALDLTAFDANLRTMQDWADRHGVALRPHANSRLGHVAAVSKIVDSRTLLIRHANWSPINGRRGQIENDVKVVDVSPDNDWSAVRVWYAPLGQLGGTHWPVEGFIYPGKAKKSERLPVRNITIAAAPRGSDPIADIIRQKLGF